MAPELQEALLKSLREPAVDPLEKELRAARAEVERLNAYIAELEAAQAEGRQIIAADAANHLVGDLLLGVTANPKSMSLKVRYLTPAEERKGREGLATLLRSRRPLARFNWAVLRVADQYEQRPGRSALKMVFQKPHRQAPQYAATFKILVSVGARVEGGGLTVEQAVAETAAEYKLSEPRIRDIWRDRGHIAFNWFMLYGSPTSPKPARV